ncbi:MAG: type VI secretion system lipoprotein TssJ [Geminicoccaceae bacterium]
MIRRTLIIASLVGLSACGGDDEPPPPAAPPPPPPPTIVSLTITASPGVNPDAAGQAKPVHVRVLRLANGAAFAEADFFALDQDLAGLLGSDLKGMDEFVLAPGAVQIWQKKLDDETRVIGVMAAYQAVDTAQWRAWKEVPRNETSLLAAELGPTGVVLREVAP